MLPEVARLPRAPGVYRFRGPGGRALYIGRAVDLRRRVASYWGDLHDRRHLRRMVPQIERVEAVVCDSEHEAAWLERNLLEHRLPRWNRTRGEEVPVHVRVDGRPRAPGLDVVHEVRATPGVAHFGPYLGSVRAQLAVVALKRVLPLAYAGDGARGSELDMARVRGVCAADRDALVRAVRSVLERDPVAVAHVREGMCSRRDDAARALAYERAAQLQAELEAFEWVVSEQKVTSTEPVSCDVTGWADGVLVRFEVREGRLRSWSQRSCSEAAARTALAATPASWSAFALRNARLAAALGAPGASGPVPVSIGGSGT